MSDLFQHAFQNVLSQIKVNLDEYQDRFPHVSKALVYPKEENKYWTAGFWPGLNCLAYQYTKNEHFLINYPSYLASFLERLQRGHTDTHDLGFLYTLSCVAHFKLTGSQATKQLAVRAADRLIDRYNSKGQYIQAWGKMGIGYPEVKIIIDTMLNLPLLYWASEVTGDPKYHQIAVNHGFITMKYLVREDYSTYHTYLMDPESGEGIVGKTHQGHRDESTWARGQAWCIYGFMLSYLYTKEPKFLEVATKSADWFLSHLPLDKVPFWDFDFTIENSDIKDTSAAAIAICGLLELADNLPDDQGKAYRTSALQMLEALVSSYLNHTIHAGRGLLLEGVYHRTDGAREFVGWGDYFFAEALIRVLTDWQRFW